MKVHRIHPGDPLWGKTIVFAENCSWVAGKHIAGVLRENCFQDWEAFFVAEENGEPLGFCTLLETDYYPENRYSPWVSSVFVTEKARGHRLSGKLIDAACAHAKAVGFEKVYLPTEITGLYEKYGFVQIDTLTNYGGDVDRVLERKL